MPYTEYTVGAKAGAFAIVWLAENDTEEGGMLVLVHSVRVAVHVAKKAGEGRMSVDPADGTQLSISRGEFCKLTHPCFIPLSRI